VSKSAGAGCDGATSLTAAASFRAELVLEPEIPEIVTPLDILRVPAVALVPGLFPVFSLITVGFRSSSPKSG
jgi:hypothetical protein